MRIEKLLVGLFVASAGDIGAGLIIIRLFGYTLEFGDLNSFLLSAIPFAVGVLLCILPDFDILISILRGEKLGLNLSGKHRQISHRPLITIPLISILTFFLTNSFWWMAISALCFMVHYTDDLFDKSGVMLFAPISLDHYEVRRNGIKVLSQADVRRDPPPVLGKWIETQLLRPTPEAVGRIAVFVLGVATVIFT